ncbi:MAG: hypothetical protein LBC87_02240 [Fibromonadaceae bacterium]|jgi:hypothetical protein|nr:hypothetical protein [Fibromonadaceae bacterium]
MKDLSLLDRVVNALPDNLDDFNDSHAEKFRELTAMDNHEVSIEKVNFTHLHPDF